MSNFFFSHSVFKRLLQQTCKTKDLFGKGLSACKYHKYSNTNIFFTAHFNLSTLFPTCSFASWCSSAHNCLYTITCMYVCINTSVVLILQHKESTPIKLSYITHYLTMPYFHSLKINDRGKHCEKSRNCLLQAMSPFLTRFSTLYDTHVLFKMHFKMSSVMRFNLDQSKILSSGNGLINEMKH